MQDNRILITDRLVLRSVTMADAEDLFEVYHDPKVMTFMETPPHSNISETQTKIIQMRAPETCYWSICLKETGQVIGNIGYLGNIGVPGMGYILGASWWRKGYMSEAVQAVLEYGFTHLGLSQVELWINQDNIASQRLAQKSGFIRRGQFRLKYEHLPESHEMWVYGIYKHEWQKDPNPLIPPLQCYSIQPILAVPNVQETAEFYRDKLNFNIDFFYGDPPTHAGISCAEWTSVGARIQLSQQPEMGVHKAPMSLYIFTGPDIETRCELYRSRGVTIERDLENLPWGMREFVIRDCNGYLLRFGTPG